MPQAQQPNTTALTRRDLPLQLREAQIEPATFNEADNSVELVWTVGARVKRYSFWDDAYYEEELVVSDDAVDMSRFDAGAIQILDNHRSYGGVGSVLGIATRGWIEGGEGRATIKLSTDPAKAGVVGDIRAGIIRSVSVGYNVAKYEVTRARDRTDGGQVDLYRAIEWTPMEISFVTVPADGAAGTRSASSGDAAQQQRTAACQFIETRAAGAENADGGRTADPTNQEQSPMKLTRIALLAAGAGVARNADPAAAGGGAGGSPAAAPAASAQPTDAERAAQQAERERSAAITELCTRHNVPNLAARLITDGRSVDQARGEVLEEIARRDAAAGGHRNVNGSVQTVQDEHETRLRGIELAIEHRVNSRVQLDDNARQYRGLSLLEIGRELLEARGVRTRGMDRMTLATQILHNRAAGSMGTSDFAHLLANVAGKRLRNAYEENPGSYRTWARRAPNAPDFKSMSVVQLAGTPDLLQVNEHGEFKYGSMSDGKETYALLTYGRIVSLTRQAMVNDDLRAFDRLVAGFGNSAARLENRTVYAQLTSNPTMGDGVALFHADHANLASGGGSALSATSLKAMRTAMRKQKGLQQEELNLVPSYLIVPAALEQDAYQLTSANYVPATKAEINEFRQGGRTALEPVIEPILDANSATAWYSAASSGQVDTVEFTYLDGAEGPVIESEMGFEVDGMSLKCRLDFAAKAIDHRGVYKSAGA
jgi:hypothetical protein